MLTVMSPDGDAKGKVVVWTGEAEVWPHWSLKFRAAARRNGWAELLDPDNEPPKPDEDGYDRDVWKAWEQKSSAMYDFLVTACNGDALDVVDLVEESDGAQAWQSLCNYYESKTEGALSILMAQLNDPNRRLPEGGDV